MSLNQKNSDCKEKPLLLFSPLDWGLGHTTRSIPLIREFASKGWKIIVACNSIQKKILGSEIYDLEFIELEGYNLNYGSGRLGTRLKLVMQVRKILTRIKQEKQWLAAFIAENPVDVVISDNRYGFTAPGVFSVFLTHQLHVKTGFNAWADKFIQRNLLGFINRFTECWVPDYAGYNNIAGELSRPVESLKIPVKYLGSLSRFRICEPRSYFEIDFLFILSGPEPQRTIFEQIILKQLGGSGKKAILVRGLPENSNKLTGFDEIEIFNHLNADKLNELICRSAFIICRSGYTSIMDLLKLQKKMILIPTPGQPEQEYLAKRLNEKHLAVSMKQHGFSLDAAEKKAREFEFRFIQDDMEQYKAVIQELLERIPVPIPR